MSSPWSSGIPSENPTPEQPVRTGRLSGPYASLGLHGPQKVVEIISFMAIIMGLGLSCYMLLGFRVKGWNGQLGSFWVI